MVQIAWALNRQKRLAKWHFCAHASLFGEPFIVPDARKDERFRENPLVTGASNIRFTTRGAPLVTEEGYKLGTLCAIDRKPRELSAEEQNILRDLAAMVMNELNLQARIHRSHDARLQSAIFPRGGPRRTASDAAIGFDDRRGQGQSLQ